MRNRVLRLCDVATRRLGDSVHLPVHNLGAPEILSDALTFPWSASILPTGPPATSRPGSDAEVGAKSQAPKTSFYYRHAAEVSEFIDDIREFLALSSRGPGSCPAQVKRNGENLRPRDKRLRRLRNLSTTLRQLRSLN